MAAGLTALLFAALAAPTASAQYRFDSWTTETGLPQNSVTSLVQTRDGYLWLGTNGGLVRFDGVRFTVFDVGRTEGLTSVRIHALLEDRAGALWIATEHGGLARYADGAFTTYTTADGLPVNGVSFICEDRDGRLWLSTVRGLVRFEGGRFTTFTTADGLPANPVSQIVEDRDGRLWFGTAHGLVYMSAGRFTTYTTRDGLPSDAVLSVYAARDGSVWAGMRAGGLVRIHAGTVTTYSMANSLPGAQIGLLREDRAGALWIGTDRGLARFAAGDPNRHAERPARSPFVTYTTRDGLSDDAIRSLLEDREGNLWVGTNTAGLNRLKPRQLTALGEAEGLPGDGVVPITEDQHGDLWIGLTCGGLVRYSGGTLTTYTEKHGLPNDCIWSLLSDRDGHLWIGTWGGGLTRRDRDGRFFTYTESNSGLASNAVLALYQDRAGILWVGTGSGLSRFEHGRFTTFGRGDGLVHEDVRFITEDRFGALWIGTAGGVSRFRDGAFTNYTRAEGLSSDFVRAIHETADGTLWLGTYGGGLNRLKDGRITHYTVRQGMFENIVSRILEDDRGNFWMTGNKGIVRVSRAELDDFAEGRTRWITPVAYGVGEGMRSSECNGGGQPAGWKGRDGRLWFPTAKGVVSLDPRGVQLSEVTPPVVIEQVLVNRREQGSQGPIDVPPGSGDLEIQYTGLSFTAPEQVRFRYKLTELDENWTDAGTRRTAYYSHLPPGTYTFTVTAASRDGVWNTGNAATVSIRVLPPFYRTWWFTSLTALGLGGLLFVLHARRVRHLTEARAAQVAFSNRLIESQEGERKRIAAELHDSLSQTLVVIKSRALLSLQSPDDPQGAMEQLEEIAEATTHAIGEVREIAYNLRPYHLDRLGLTKAIDVMIDRVSAANGLRFTKRLDSLDGVFPKDAEINVYRIVQEGITNIVKHAGAATASVTIERAPRSVVITIRDDGRGFTVDGAQPAGFGLIGMAERARLLGGDPIVESTPGHGTIVRVILGTGNDDGDSDSRSDRR